MEGDEIIEMDRMRKMIANHMVMSKHVSPHVTSFVEAMLPISSTGEIRLKMNFLSAKEKKSPSLLSLLMR